MPFKSEAQRRYFHSQLPQLAQKWEEHTPKGKRLPKKVRREKLEKEAFDTGFYSTLAKAGAFGQLPTEDASQASEMILQIIKDPTLTPSQKNLLIARLSYRPAEAIPTHRQLLGADQDPLHMAILNSHMQRQQEAEEAQHLSPFWRNIPGLDSLYQLISSYPLFGDVQVQDQRRSREEEWPSPWKTNQV
jgi:hypothetical protein